MYKVELSNYLKRLLSGSSGFVLVEVSVAVAILSLGVGLVGSAVFQTLSIQRYWQADAIAVKDTRHAEYPFSRETCRLFRNPAHNIERV